MGRRGEEEGICLGKGVLVFSLCRLCLEPVAAAATAAACHEACHDALYLV